MQVTKSQLKAPIMLTASNEDEYYPMAAKRKLHRHTHINSDPVYTSAIEKGDSLINNQAWGKLNNESQIRKLQM